MKVGEDQNRFTVSAVAALVPHSPILLSWPACRTRFPNGYEHVDIQILEWLRRPAQLWVTRQG
jgi:hypothetical protein